MSYSRLLEITEHRAWPPPSAPWVMRMAWHDLLFAHWPVPVEMLRPLIPPQLPLDTFQGTAWVGVVPFRMTNVAPRYVPPIPGISALPELNVRTYVTAPGGTTGDPTHDKPGVYFFSLDASIWLVVAAARLGFKLPYLHASMRLFDHARQTGPDPTAPDLPGSLPGQRIDYRSKRTHSGAPPAQFEASYAPAGQVYASRPGTLEHWLTERYALYTAGADYKPGEQRPIYRCDIHHVQWPLQPAVAEIRVNTMAAAAGITLPDVPPLLHFARRIDMIGWPLVLAK